MGLDGRVVLHAGRGSKSPTTFRICGRPVDLYAPRPGARTAERMLCMYVVTVHLLASLPHCIRTDRSPCGVEPKSLTAMSTVNTVGTTASNSRRRAVCWPPNATLGQRTASPRIWLRWRGQVMSLGRAIKVKASRPTSSARCGVSVVPKLGEAAAPSRAKASDSGSRPS